MGDTIIPLDKTASDGVYEAHTNESVVNARHARQFDKTMEDRDIIPNQITVRTRNHGDEGPSYRTSCSSLRRS